MKWIEDRRESFAATTHGRGQVDYVDLALDSEGRIVGLRCKIIADLGAYAQVNTEVIPTLSNLVLSGCYDIPALYSELIAVYTTLPPTDAYRGAGRPEGVHLVERVVDVAAREAGIDPAEFRRKNFVPKEKFPFPSKAGVEYELGGLRAGPRPGPGDRRLRRAAGGAAPGQRRSAGAEAAGDRPLQLHRAVRV